MKKLTYFFCLVGFMTASATYGQNLKWGPSVSLGISDMAIGSSENVDHKQLTYYSIGALAENSLTSHLSLRFGGRFTRKGVKKNMQRWNGTRDETFATREFNFLYMELPLALSVDFGEPEGFFLTGGVYYGLALSGKMKDNIFDESETKSEVVFNSTYDPFEPHFQLKGSDFGYIAMLGYKKEQVMVDLGINASIADVKPEDHPSDKKWNFVVIKLNVTYLLADL